MARTRETFIGPDSESVLVHVHPLTCTCSECATSREEAAFNQLAEDERKIHARHRSYGNFEYYKPEG
jgi:hypothetical protein